MINHILHLLIYMVHILNNNLLQLVLQIIFVNLLYLIIGVLINQNKKLNKLYVNVLKYIKY